MTYADIAGVVLGVLIFAAMIVPPFLIAGRTRRPKPADWQERKQWRGKIRVIEHTYGDGSKDYSAEYWRQSIIDTWYWDDVRDDANDQAPTFAKQDDARIAAQRAWNDANAGRVVSKRKVWP